MQIDRHIWKYFSGNANQKEIDDLHHWLNSSDENKELFKTMETVWQTQIGEQDISNEEEAYLKIFSQFNKKNKLSQHRHLDWNFYIRIAASVLIIVGSILLVIKVAFNQFNTKDVVIQAKSIEKYNPAGQKSRLFLPDGSIVWLSSDSKIVYLEDFSDSVRHVELEGEAYFDVAKDQRPFTVNSANIKTTALGTAFNINNYEDNSEVSISLFSGVVQVDGPDKTTLILQAGEGLKVNLLSLQKEKYAIDEYITLAWKNGILIFNNESLQSFINKIERWYGIEVNITGNLPSDWSFTGTFKDEYLSNVMQIIQYTKDFDYEIKNEKLTIKF